MPSLIFMAAFTVWPVFRSIWLSLTKYKLGMSAPEFLGLKNYISLAGSSLFWKPKIPSKLYTYLGGQPI